ncbi:MAG: DUF4199 family protein [Microscillaceae bacterium]|nr:DUF4199 family protein [Microscillaceae bacterium]MDW8460085.1 DUF4199 family protein [Cytophagales bacterium]
MPSIISIALRTSIIAAGSYILYFLSLYWIYQNPFVATPKSLDFFIYVLAMVVASYVFRFRINQGRYSFWQGMALCSLTALKTLLITLVFMACFLTSLPKIVEIYKNYQIKAFLAGKAVYLQAMKIEDTKQKEQTFANIVKDLEKLDNSTWFRHILQKELFEKLLLSAFLAFVVSALFRN